MHCCPDDSESIDESKPKIRECTDIVWLYMFLVFIILMILSAVFSFVYGNPMRLINGYDSFGNVCGSDSNDKFGDYDLSGVEMSDKKYLFFMDYENAQQSLQICVKQCPNKNLETMEDLKQFYDTTGSSLCSYDFNFTKFDTSRYYSHLLNNLPNSSTYILSSSYGPCPKFPVYKSVPVLNRCVPEPAKDVAVNLLNHVYGILNSWDFIEEALGDLYKSWYWILSLVAVSFVLSLLVVSILHVVASMFAWIIMLIVSVACIGVTVISWWTYFSIKCKLDVIPQEQLLEEMVNNEDAFLCYSIISSILTVVVLLLVYSMRHRVTFLTTLFEESSNCLSEIPTLYVQPFLSFGLLSLFYTFWISVVVCLATASYPGIKPLKRYSDNMLVGYHNSSELKDLIPVNVSIGEMKSFTAVEYVESTWLKYMLILYFIGLVWMSEFILACQHMVVAGSVAKWYFNRERENTISLVLTSMGNLVCYHLGSVAVGSLLITVFKIPRLILSGMQSKLRRKKRDSKLAECSYNNCTCCFYCLEVFIRYMNHNAYTVIAVQGINFCPASYRAWKVVTNNALRLWVVNSVGDLALFLGKCSVTAVVGIAAVILFGRDPTLHFYAGPVLVVCVFSFFVAHAVISLYELIIDTLFLCICEDQQMNGADGYWKDTLLGKMECGNRKATSTVAPTEI